MHSMICVETYPTGAEEWLCPECGRHFIMRWPPLYRRIVLNAGNEAALHSGTHGDIQMDGVQVFDEQSSRLETLLSDIELDGG